MDHAWQFQLRLTASEALAPELRSDPSGHAYAPLHEVLQRHGAQLVCQYDAFAGYVSEAEKEGVEKYPLYQWTKDTIENPAKQGEIPEVVHGVREGRRGVREGCGGRAGA
ncbi:protein of unknown function [Paraburkholderia kururiensis]